MFSLWSAIVVSSVVSATPEVIVEAEESEEDSFSVLDGELFGYFGLQSQAYLSGTGIFEQPEHLNGSVSLEPGYVLSLGEDTTFRTVLFGRVDGRDAARRHFDVRELYVETYSGDWTFAIGVRRVFWGVVESRHLVDIVNQTDLVENIDGEDKLGQPMVKMGVEGEDLGGLELFLLPYFRARTFAGEHGRLRPPVLISEDVALESSLGRGHPDLAVRWTKTIDDFDWGLSYFYGHSREPELVPQLVDGTPELLPTHSLIHQVGLEGQWIVDAWLFKVESIVRAGQGSTFSAVSGGFEYTWSGAFGTRADLGFIAEGHYDGRDNLTFNLFDHDVFGGMRLALNDEQDLQVLAGAVVDVSSGGTFASIEASRRLGERMKLSLEGRLFAAADEEEPLYVLRKEDYVQLDLEVYF